MPAQQEGEPKKEELARLEVPRTLVNLLGDELTGRQKLTVMDYLKLEDALSALGQQRLEKTTIDNIPLKPIRDWATQHWGGESVLDLSKRNIPISFRASLSLALFTTRITEHLTNMQGGVEVYATNNIQKVFEKYKLPIPQGLATIDYASLPPQVKSDLVLPIIDNLSSAKLVAHAKALFPNGVPTNALYLADPSMIMALAFSGNTDDVIFFDKIKNLNIQAMAAEIALNNIGRMVELSVVIKASEARSKDNQGEETTEKEKNFDWEGEDKEPELRYDVGTKFSQVFPYRDGETEEDMLRAYRRITKGGAYNCAVGEPLRGEYLKVHISNEGKLIGYYGWNKGFTVDEPIQEELDMLSGKLEGEYADSYRGKAVRALVSGLIDDMDANKQAIDLAKQEYGQTSFTVEKGFLQALSGNDQKEATQTEIKEDERLAREAKKTVAQLSEEDIGETSTQLTLISKKPVNMETVDLDYRILNAIRDNYNLSHTQLLKILGSLNHPIREENIGEWFKSCSSLLNRYQSVVVSIGQLFAVLDIAPTNDEKAIRNAYRKVANQTHPDRTTDLQPDEKVATQQKFQEATAAYKEISGRIGTIGTDRSAPTRYLGKISELFQPEVLQEDTSTQ